MAPPTTTAASRKSSTRSSSRQSRHHKAADDAAMLPPPGVRVLHGLTKNTAMSAEFAAAALHQARAWHGLQDAVRRYIVRRQYHKMRAISSSTGATTTVSISAGNNNTPQKRGRGNVSGARSSAALMMAPPRAKTRRHQSPVVSAVVVAPVRASPSPAAAMAPPPPLLLPPPPPAATPSLSPPGCWGLQHALWKSLLDAPLPQERAAAARLVLQHVVSNDGSTDGNVVMGGNGHDDDQDNATLVVGRVLWDSLKYDDNISVAQLRERLALLFHLQQYGHNNADTAAAHDEQHRIIMATSHATFVRHLLRALQRVCLPVTAPHNVRVLRARDYAETLVAWAWLARSVLCLPTTTATTTTTTRSGGGPAWRAVWSQVPVLAALLVLAHNLRALPSQTTRHEQMALWWYQTLVPDGLELQRFCRLLHIGGTGGDKSARAKNDVTGADQTEESGDPTADTDKKTTIDVVYLGGMDEVVMEGENGRDGDNGSDEEDAMSEEDIEDGAAEAPAAAAGRASNDHGDNNDDAAAAAAGGVNNDEDDEYVEGDNDGDDDDDEDDDDEVVPDEDDNSDYGNMEAGQAAAEVAAAAAAAVAQRDEQLLSRLVFDELVANEDDDDDDDDDSYADSVASRGGDVGGRGADDAEQVANGDGGVALTDAGAHAQDTHGETAADFDLHLPPLHVRQANYVRAAMMALDLQYRVTIPQSLQRQGVLVAKAESSILESINAVIQPPKKPLTTKVIMRRAGTQEEFFRGSLKQNPIAIANLASGKGAKAPKGGEHDPTVGDLRQHIAHDLQMNESAELLEIIVANKILDTRLKLRVVHHVLWRNHLLEDRPAGSSSSSGPSAAASIFASSAGLVLFSSGTSDRVRHSVTDSTPLEKLPAMIATYRLAGVDGEATEDTVGPDDLLDPEALDVNMSSQAVEEQVEKEFGLTRIVMEGRGVYVLLRAMQYHIGEIVRRIRRDDVGAENGRNPSRESFIKSAPPAALILLEYCSKLRSNREKLLQARAPTVMLNVLLEVLKCLESPSTGASSSNATSDKLQELIEKLTSDITTFSEDALDDDEGYENDARDAASMPLLLESIRSVSLGSSLRTVIAKLLPYLTYGQSDLSRELAEHFDKHIVPTQLFQCEIPNAAPSQEFILMNTFVQTAITLPASEVCNSLRRELVGCGFASRLVVFILKDVPDDPPPWSAALWSKADYPNLNPKKRGKSPSAKFSTLEKAWQIFYHRHGVQTALKVLHGLCRMHVDTQTEIGSIPQLIAACHWLESTSDSAALGIATKSVGLLAEALLDEIIEGGSIAASGASETRHATRMRKKEIAEERRTKALLKMSSFSSGPLEGADTGSEHGARSSEHRSVTPTRTRSGKAVKRSKPDNAAKPSWMTEMESMEDEAGLTCAVCQEGRSLQPAELLGLYAYVKKVLVPHAVGGSRNQTEGITMLQALPSELPKSLSGVRIYRDWFQIGKAASEDLPEETSSSGSSSTKKSHVYTTTVSAGNAIHFSCHRNARTADSNHPKAPKSEWEGAMLRNNRVNCNVIVPLVSNRSSSVPLYAVDSALSDHQSAVMNLLGGAPKSMLWIVLHDVLLLLLRIAHGESLSTDCGGGSLMSNMQLVLHQLLAADMFEKDSQVCRPSHSQHARCLSAGFLAASGIVGAADACGNLEDIIRGVGDAAPMAVLTSIVFHNAKSDDDSVGEGTVADAVPKSPDAKRRWVLGRESFFHGLLVWAGRRQQLGQVSSGCVAATRSGRPRASSFSCWNSSAASTVDNSAAASESRSSEGDSSKPRTRRSKHQKASAETTTPNPTPPPDTSILEPYQLMMRTMLTLFIVFDQLSAVYMPTMDDADIEAGADQMVAAVQKCHGAHNLGELMQLAQVQTAVADMHAYFQKGVTSSADTPHDLESV